MVLHLLKKNHIKNINLFYPYNGKFKHACAVVHAVQFEYGVIVPKTAVAGPVLVATNSQQLSDALS